jgi:hypothetical protein
VTLIAALGIWDYRHAMTDAERTANAELAAQAAQRQQWLKMKRLAKVVRITK